MTSAPGRRNSPARGWVYPPVNPGGCDQRDERVSRPRRPAKRRRQVEPDRGSTSVRLGSRMRGRLDLGRRPGLPRPLDGGPGRVYPRRPPTFSQAARPKVTLAKNGRPTGELAPFGSSARRQNRARPHRLAARQGDEIGGRRPHRTVAKTHAIREQTVFRR